jgi:SAM-dependent methyltransferase
VERAHQESAERTRRNIERGRHDPARFRATLLGVPATVRDAWLDRVLGLEGHYEDDPALPSGCVPYLPCEVDALVRLVEHTAVGPADVFVDIGAGVGRAATFVHLLTGARAIGIEIQPTLVLAARNLTSRLSLPGVACIEGDAANVSSFMTIGSVFFLYCPFSGGRLAKVLDDLEPIARTRMLRICCMNLPRLDRDWLIGESIVSDDVTVYRSSLHLQAGEGSL